MDKCKFCQEVLDENSAICPHCGKDNAAPQPPVEEALPQEQTVAEETAGEETVAEETTVVVSDESGKPEETAAEETGEQKPEPTPIQEGVKATPGKIALAAALVILLLAALIALVVMGLDSEEIPEETAGTTAALEETEAPATVPADGNPEDVTCKGTYTVTDEAAKAAMDRVVAELDGVELTNAQLQVYYWSVVNSYLSSDFGYQLMYYGLLDYTQPLDTQMSFENESLTWQQFFLQEALDYWQMNQAMSLEAADAEMEMTQEDRDYLDELPESLAATAEYYGLSGVDELILNNVGPGATLEDFIHFQEVYYQGRPYYDAQMEKLAPTAQEIEDYFTENESRFAESGITKEGNLYVDVRHILVQITGGTTDENGNTTYSDEEWKACEEKAQALLDQWLAGEASEESFAALANETSEDPGSNTNGGLYEQVTQGQMVEPFEQWCFDTSRKTGDYGLVKTDYGYHVMYYVSGTPAWEHYSQQELTNERTNSFIDALTEDHPMEVDYSAIELGFIDLAG